MTYLSSALTHWARDAPTARQEAAAAGLYDNVWQGVHRLDLHEMTATAAVAAVVVWLSAVEVAAPSSVPETMTVVTGWGKHSKLVGQSPMKAAVVGWLEEHQAPFRPVPNNPGAMQADGPAVAEWLRRYRRSGGIVASLCAASKPAYKAFRARANAPR